MKFAFGGLSPSRADILSSYPYTYILFFFLPVCPLRASVLTLSRGDTMKKSVLMFSLLSGTALMFPKLTIASGLPAHTLTYTPEPKPAFQFEQLDKAYKTAGICFLGVGNCGGAAGYDSSSSGTGSANDDFYIDTSNQCLNEGFVRQNCNSVQTIDGVCPYNSAYGLGCKCRPDLISCPAGQVGVGESCDEMYASCECDPALVSCASNQVGQGASCGGKYQSCVCKSEYIYNSSNCTSPRSVSGASCGGKYTGCSCPSGVSSGSYGCEEYYASPCSSVCKKAYADNCRNRTAVSTPYGCAEYWSDCSSKCKTKYNDNCRNRSAVISSCPANATCSYFSDCSSKIQSWSCNSGYKQEGSSCVVASETCKIGSIYYTDGTCLSAANHQTNKTVLGIVVHTTNNGKHGQIMTPWPIDANGNKTNSNSTGLVWAKWGTDISSIPKFPSWEEASTDYDSCGNTDKIVALCAASNCQAAWATRKYAPTAATKGKWCLPATGIMVNIYNNQDTIQTAISKAGGVSYPNCCTWSSSTAPSGGVWYSNFNISYNHGVVYEGLGGGNYVRPVLEF
ncbi:MAG: hypothetical protein ACLU5H_04810 [Alphaproteobacteria bacterium]